MKKFKMQSLTKAEMNKIRGGLTVVACSCHVTEAYQMWLLPGNAIAKERVNSINSRCSKGGSCQTISA